MCDIEFCHYLRCSSSDDSVIAAFLSIISIKLSVIKL